jgi:hypothetical protein
MSCIVRNVTILKIHFKNYNYNYNIKILNLYSPESTVWFSSQITACNSSAEELNSKTLLRRTSPFTRLCHGLSYILVSCKCIRLMC